MTTPDPTSEAADPTPGDTPADDGARVPDDTLDPDRAWARRLHERTGEVELLISGGMLLALTQAPGHLDAWWDAVGPRLSGPFFSATFVVWYYANLMTFTLVGAFALHIVARAYWIGLLGLDSVFPDGIRWARVRYGPITRDTYRRVFRTLPAMAHRADRFGSTIFSLAFWIVLLFLLSTVLAALAAVGALALGRLVPSLPLGAAWWALLGVIVIGPLVGFTLDRLVGRRLDPAGRVARVIRGMVLANYRTLAGPLLLPIQLTLFSNLRRGAMTGVIAIVVFLLIGVFIVGEQTRAGDLVMSASETFPSRPGAATADARYYEDRAVGGASGGLPTIQSDVIEGPYVRVRLPFVARRDEAPMRERCPKLPALGRGGPRATSLSDPPPDAAVEEALIGCMSGLWRVMLDGAPVHPAWALDAGRGAGIDGLVSYIPTAPLAPGAHLLEVTQAWEEEKTSKPGEPPPLRRHFIRFWI